MPRLPPVCTVYAEAGLRPGARAPPKPRSALGRAHTWLEDLTLATPSTASLQSALICPPCALAAPPTRRLLSLALTSHSRACTCSTHAPGDNIVTGLAINFLIGLACYVGFVLWRGRFKIYYARLVLPQVRLKPPPLRLGGLWQLW